MKSALRVAGTRVTALALFALAANAGNAATQVNIESPSNNAVLTAAAVHVSGTVVSTDRNIGITVNGIAAWIDLEPIRSDGWR